MTTPKLEPVARFTVPASSSSDSSSSSFDLVISRGSVVAFEYAPNPSMSGIVNAANEECLGGGGVDGAISDAGGPALMVDRRALPVRRGGVRCPTGEARLTGPGAYGTLAVPFVIHAVGPSYWDFEGRPEQGDGLLQSAYLQSLDRAKEAGLEAVAFSLLCAGVFRGPERSLKEVLNIGVESICSFDAHDELKEVHMCAFSPQECDTLTEILSDLGLSE